MMEKKYEIENLIKTFLEHHEEFLKDREELRKKYPDSPHIRDAKNEFSVALALHSICLEIEKLKRIVGNA